MQRRGKDLPTFEHSGVRLIIAIVPLEHPSMLPCGSAREEEVASIKRRVYMQSVKGVCAGVVLICSGVTFFPLYSDTPTHDLVDVRKCAPGIRIDIRYATTNNFTGKLIYKKWSGGCYLRRALAQQLAKVQEELEKQGLGLLIWDAYRPMPAQWELWNAAPDKKYVANPRKGGRHTRGTTVDCTIINLKTGELLSMPTEFDNFTKRAWRDCQDLPEEAKRNRKTLENVMAKHGFIGLPQEWWHFDHESYLTYQPMEIDFDRII